MKINDTIINADCEEVLTELQRQLSINHIPYLQRLQDSGKDIMVQCPFHGNGQENRPSAGIRKSDGMLHCFACNAVHTLPEVISYCFNKDDMFGKWGMRWLIKNFATVQIEERQDVEIDMERNNTTNKNNVLDRSISSESNTFVSEEELDSYRFYHQYWKTRGIVDENIIDLFDLGYDIKARCITMPVRDANGNCLFVARRSIDRKWFNYPKNAEKPLYGLYELRKAHIQTKKLFITESMIDAILLWQSGRYAVALNGLGSEKQFKQLRQLPIRHYVLATDNDSAGEKARDRLRFNVKGKLFTEIDFPKGIKDIGECDEWQLNNIERWEVF